MAEHETMKIISGGSARADFAGDTWSIPLLQLAAALIVAFAVVLYLTPFGAAVSPDSILYLDIATHIHNGQGVTSTDYALAHAGENRAVPNTIWPPLYPAVLALSATQPGVASAAILSALLLAATLFFTQRILCDFLSWPLATLAALPLAGAVPMLTIHTFAWSEQLFIAILTALLLVARRYLSSDDSGARRRSLALIALLLVLAFYTRYIGILFFPLLPLLYLTSGRTRPLLPIFLAAGLACALAVLALLMYNLHVSGSLTGTSRQAANTTVFEQLRNLVSALVPLFQGGNSLSRIALFTVGAAAGLLYLLNDPRLPERPQRENVARLALGLALYYLVCILALRSVVAFDEIDVRLVGVVVPYGWIGCVALVAGFAWRPAKAIPAMLAAVVIAGLAVNGYFTAFNVRANWQASGSPWFRINASNAYINYNLPPGANQSRQFFAARANADSILVTDQPQVMRYTTALTAYALPTEFSGAELRNLANAPARSYIILYAEQREAFEKALRERGARVPAASIEGDSLLLPLPLELNAPVP
jgi:hypothetical protein